MRQVYRFAAVLTFLVVACGDDSPGNDAADVDVDADVDREAVSDDDADADSDAVVDSNVDADG